MPASAFGEPSGLVFGWKGTTLSVIAKRGQAAFAVPMNMTRLCVGYALWPSEWTCAQIFWPLLPCRLPAGQA